MAYRPPTNVQRRAGVYYFRFVIPAPFRPLFGKSEVHLSLGTAYLREARPKAIRLASIFHGMIEYMGDGMADKLTPEVENMMLP